jgi:hypothetical protein
MPSEEEMNKLAQDVYYGGMVGAANAAYIPPTDRQKLEQKRLVLMRELEAVMQAIETLDAHPDLEEFTKILQRALR